MREFLGELFGSWGSTLERSEHQSHSSALDLLGLDKHQDPEPGCYGSYGFEMLGQGLHHSFLVASFRLDERR